MKFFESVVANIVANFAGGLIILFLGWAATKLFNHYRWWLVTAGQRLATGFLVLSLCNALVFFLAYKEYIDTDPFVFTWAINTLGLSAIATMTYYRFRRLGIVQAFSSTDGGIDHTQTLMKPRNSFDFLGVGAHKLTTNPNFVKMLSRCAQARRPVRLLLSHPDNPVLTKVNSRTKLKNDEYASRVRESLAKLAEFKKSGYNIEVRFYRNLGESATHQFRLVFIDERICVLSYTVWDEKEGGSNPQLLLTSDGPSDSARSLYAAFKDHFYSIWDDSGTQQVNLDEYELRH